MQFVRLNRFARVRNGKDLDIRIKTMFIVRGINRLCNKYFGRRLDVEGIRSVLLVVFVDNSLLQRWSIMNFGRDAQKQLQVVMVVSE